MMMNIKLLPLLASAASLLVISCAPARSNSPAAVSPPSVYLRTNAEVAVVDFFDMYCHSCQKLAPHVNELHSLVQKRGLGSKIAFYAVGWSNTELEADLYRKRFAVPFPVIPDRELAISSRYGNFRPPLLIALRREAGVWKEFYRTDDASASPQDLLKSIWK